MEQLASVSEKEVDVYNAKLAEQVERYDEMLNYMEKVAEESSIELTVEERNLLSVAFKNVVGARRASWRILSTIAAKSGEDDRKNEPILRSYIGEVESELKQYCERLLVLLDGPLIANCSNSEASIFYLKMKGDYQRYLAEFQSGDERKKAAEESLKAYKRASDQAIKDLLPTNPVRLGLALNFSVFYYEILDAPEKACKLARVAFNDAMPEVDKLQESEYKDAALILQLLRDNLTLWTSELKNDGDEKTKDELQDVDGNED